jgi:VIT1/CCC1 family predicted Fe2+/Mn2+ transporter
VGPALDFNAWARRFGIDRDQLRAMIVDANDGIIAVSGVVEGISGAGAPLLTLLVAAASATIAGAMALAGAKYLEVATQREAQLAVMREEERQLSLSPAEELAELSEAYRRKGLSPELARQVAEELTARDALAAHLEAEHGITPDTLAKPLLVSALSALAFALGSAIPFAAGALIPTRSRSWGTVIAVSLALALTSLFGALSDQVSIPRAMARTVGIGVVTMVLTLAVGRVLVS